MTVDSPFSVALINMPFHGCTSPSMALGLLKAILGSAGIEAKVYNFNLDFLKFALEDPAMASDRDLEFEHVPLPSAGEWVFRPWATADQELQSAVEFARTLQPGEDIAALVAMRAKIGPFLLACTDKIVKGRHDIVCFQVSYMQTQAALRVAEMVRRLEPSTRIVLGGASAFGIKGRAMIEAFPVVDVVCHGEADLLIEPVVRALRGEPGHVLDGLKGVSFRGANGLRLGRDDGPQAILDELPPPDHAEFVAQTTAMVAAGALNPRARLSLTFETARGCWWAAKHHCSFCSLAHPAFRPKSPARVVWELDTLAQRHAATAFYCVDNNLEPGYFDTVLPLLAKRNYRFLWNIKPNLSRGQFEQLAQAGILSVVIGVESLLTPTLALMNKGSTAIRNIQALKWCSEFGILPIWNYLSHVPGERLEWLQALAQLLPRIMHLAPPLASRVAVERDSPYHANAEHFGLQISGPDAQGPLAFAEVAPELVEQLSHNFEYTIAGRDPAIDAFFAQTIWPQVSEWRAKYMRQGCTLSIVHGPSESLVIHGPFWAPTRLTTVRGGSRGLLLASESVRRERFLPARLRDVQADAPASAAVYQQLLTTLSRNLEPPGVLSGGATLQATLPEVEAALLIVSEGDQVLSLPVDRTAYARSSACGQRLALRRLRDLFVDGTPTQTA